MEKYEMNQDLAARWIGAWNRHDPEGVALLCARDYLGVDIAEAQAQDGPEGLRQSAERYFKAFPDLSLTRVETVIGEDRVALEWVAEGTHGGTIMNIPPTGRRVQVRGASFLTCADGQIKQARTVWDLAGLLREIGLLPELA